MAEEIENAGEPPDPNTLPELFTPNQWQALSARFRLSPRQSEVARLICLGLRKQQMAARLRVSEATARLHVKELFQKLHVNDRVGVPVRFVIASRELES